MGLEDGRGGKEGTNQGQRKRAVWRRIRSSRRRRTRQSGNRIIQHDAKNARYLVVLPVAPLDRDQDVFLAPPPLDQALQGSKIWVESENIRE